MNKVCYCGVMVVICFEKSFYCFVWDLYEGEVSFDGFVEFDFFIVLDWCGCFFECFWVVVLLYFFCKKVFFEGGRDYFFVWWGDFSFVWEFEDIVVFVSCSFVGF